MDDDHNKKQAKGLRINDYVVNELAAIEDVTWDPATQMVTLPNGDWLTAEEYKRLTRSPTGRTPTSPPMQGGRRAGQRSNRFMRDLAHFQDAHQDRSTVDKAHLSYLLTQVDGLVIVAWVSKHRYTYVAVNAGDWYISGRGDWYGKNQFTEQEFIEDVVTHPEVTAIRLVTTTELLWQR